MSEDFLHTERITLNDPAVMINERHQDLSLLYLQEKLQGAGKTLKDFNLPTPRYAATVQDRANNSELLRELQYNKEEQQNVIKEKGPLLNPEQKEVYNYVCNCLENNRPSMLFVDAPGGTGKTFLTNLVISKVRSEGGVAIAVASSGIAATRVPGGRTAHSRFKIPIKVKENLLCNIDKTSDIANLMRNAKLIVWDECPMIRRECFEAVDRTLRDKCDKDVPFGGILTVCCGDFRQLLPVVKRGTDADVENACIKKSYLWRSFIIFKLKTNMRLREGEVAYSEFLLAVGEDRIAKNENQEIHFPQDMVLPIKIIENCRHFIYPSFDNPLKLFSKNCILVPLNEMMRQINSTYIRYFPGIMKEYCAFNTVTDEANATHFPTEFLDSIELSGLPPHRLELKKGSPVILMRNLDPPKLCNGTRMIVEELHDNLIIAKIITGRFKNVIVMIPRLKISLSEGEDIPLLRTVSNTIVLCYDYT